MPTGIIVCGSILPMNCPWGKIHSSIFKRPRQDGELPWVWNDIAGRDLFPLLARVVSEGYGDSGVNTLTDATPKLIVNRVHGRLDHSGFFIKKENGYNVLNKEFVRDYWLPIIRGEDAPPRRRRIQDLTFCQKVKLLGEDCARACRMDCSS